MSAKVGSMTAGDGHGREGDVGEGGSKGSTRSEESGEFSSMGKAPEREASSPGDTGDTFGSGSGAPRTADGGASGKQAKGGPTISEDGAVVREGGEPPGPIETGEKGSWWEDGMGKGNCPSEEEDTGAEGGRSLASSSGKSDASTSPATGRGDS